MKQDEFDGWVMMQVSLMCGSFGFRLTTHQNNTWYLSSKSMDISEGNDMDDVHFFRANVTVDLTKKVVHVGGGCSDVLTFALVGLVGNTNHSFSSLDKALKAWEVEIA